MSVGDGAVPFTEGVGCGVLEPEEHGLIVEDGVAAARESTVAAP